MALTFKHNFLILNSKFPSGKGSLEEVVNKLIDLVIYGYMIPAIVRPLLSDFASVNYEDLDACIADFFNELKQSKFIANLLYKSPERYSSNSFYRDQDVNDFDWNLSHNIENSDQEMELLSKLVMSLSNINQDDGNECFTESECPCVKLLGPENVEEIDYELDHLCMFDQSFIYPYSNNCDVLDSKSNIETRDEESRKTFSDLVIPEYLWVERKTPHNEINKLPCFDKELQNIVSKPPIYLNLNGSIKSNDACPRDNFKEQVTANIGSQENSDERPVSCDTNKMFQSLHSQLSDSEQFCKSFDTFGFPEHHSADISTQTMDYETAKSESIHFHSYSSTTMLMDSEISINESTESTFNLETVGMFQLQIIKSGAIVTELQDFGTSEKLHLKVGKYLSDGIDYLFNEVSSEKRLLTKTYDDENNSKKEIEFHHNEDVKNSSIEMNSEKRSHLIDTRISVMTSYPSVRQVQYLFIIPTIILFIYFCIILFRSWVSVTKTLI